MLSEFYGLPRSDIEFNLFYLEPQEVLISSVVVSLKSGDFESESGKLHLNTRSFIFQPTFSKHPLLKFKLSSNDFSYSFNFPPSLSITQSPNSKSHSSTVDRESRIIRHANAPDRNPSSKSIKRAKIHRGHHTSDGSSTLIISVKSYGVISRSPPSPCQSQQVAETFFFEMSQGDLLKLSTELDMIMRSTDEKAITSLVYSVRYKESLSMLQNVDDFNPDDILLTQKCKRILPEGEQWGSFVMTQESLHFYPLINAKPKRAVHIQFKIIYSGMRYRYLWRNNGLRIDYYGSKYPVLFIFETEEQRENIYNFLLNRVKFKSPADQLVDAMEKWRNGYLSNFQYLMFLNNIGNRSVLDMTQYPIFPWILSKYHGEDLPLYDYTNFRDLSKPIGSLDRSKLEKLEALQVESKNQIEPPSLYSSFYSTSTIVSYFLLRQIPEFLVRNQNQIYSTQDKMFNSVEKSWNSSIKMIGDNKELIPEFYSRNPDFLLNLNDMELTNDEKLSDVEIPPWSRDANSFTEIMRDALESDFVSENLHNWIDLIFGYRQRGEQAVASLNTFPSTCYGINWNSFKSTLEKDAYEILLREFGSCPKQLFFIPHSPRSFRLLPETQKPIEKNEAVLRQEISQLEDYLDQIQDYHQEQLNKLLKQYQAETDSLKRNHIIAVEVYQSKIKNKK
ncbi:NSMAF_2 [Blepharisma stoltei]|uniref:Beige/BEACH domain containing protein n=1 Tax=Blepharisma stoltei TaxID=1481888 RepID=A0AAU9IXQ3_9CILI|nr:unnamed protein product [Blepharisma stoltei]